MDLERLDTESVEVWPCVREERLGGWRLRFAGGGYGRSNSVQPYGDPGLPLAEAVAYCEEAYRAEELAPSFRLPTFLDGSLDSHLASRGYEVRDTTHVQVASMDREWGGQGVEFSEDPSEEWMEAYLFSSKREPRLAGAIREVQRRIPAPRCYATARQGDEIASLGVGAVHLGTLWIFNIATAEEHRGKGLASDISGALLNWGRSLGAERAALQVLTTNEPALRLYSKFGFETVYGYSYRRLA